MARASYVYVVQDGGWGGTPKVAFTVKAELVTWLRQEPGAGWRLRVFRVADGGRSIVTELNARELMAVTEGEVGIETRGGAADASA